MTCLWRNSQIWLGEWDFGQGCFKRHFVVFVSGGLLWTFKTAGCTPSWVYFISWLKCLRH